MKILVVSQYFFPETFRINDIVSGLVGRCHEVTVLTGMPNYPNGQIYNGYEESYKTISFYCGAKIVRCKIRPRYNGSRNLFLNYLSFVLSASKKIKKIGKIYDVIYVYGVSPITQALPAISYSKKNNVPIVYYCMDLWPESVLGAQNGHKALSKSNIIYIVAKFISKYIYKKVGLICSKCNEFNDYLIDECNVCSNKLFVLPEHAESFYLNVNELPNDNKIFDFYYLGNIGSAQNCEMILYAASKIKNSRRFNIHFVGGGSNAENIKQLSKKLELDNIIRFHPFCSNQKELINYYNEADACLLTISNKTQTGITPPGKLFGYMASCRSVIASLDGPATGIIEQSKCGWCVESNDIDGFADLLIFAIDNKDLCNEYGKNGRKYFIQNYSLDVHLNKLELFLKKATFKNRLKGDC